MSKEISLVFTGDIGFDRYMDKKWNDDDLISDEVLYFLHSGDHVIANVEGPLVRQERNTVTEGTVQLMHTMDPDATKVLKNMGADIWNLCNNHIMDAGEEGVRNTLQEAARFGAKTLGVGMNTSEALKVLYLKEAGGIGIFSVGYRRGCKPADEAKAGTITWDRLDLIEKNIKEIKSKCRWCIVVVHGGEEFTSLPSPYTRDRFLNYLHMGADLIVTHHPHVPMNYELFEKKAIFYSLGNFIFDTDYQRVQFDTDLGVLLKLKLSESDYSFEAMGIKIDRNTEHVEAAPLPGIFTEVDEKNYELLAPLSAKAFVSATKRQQIYLDKNKASFTDADWKAHFSEEKRSGRVPGEALDFQIICPLSDKADEGAWK